MSTNNKKMWRTAVPILELDTKTDGKPKISDIHYSTTTKKSNSKMYLEIIRQKLSNLMKKNVDEKPFSDISIDESCSIEGVNPGFVDSTPSSSRETLNEIKKPSPPLSSNPRVPSNNKPLPIDFHPHPPFSCLPVYIFIIICLCCILIAAVIHTVIAVKPEFLYSDGNQTSSEQNYTTVTLAPQ